MRTFSQGEDRLGGLTPFFDSGLQDLSDEPRRPGAVLRFFVFREETIVRTPVHTPGFVREVFSGMPSQLFFNPLCPAEGSAVWRLALTIVRKLVAVPASKDRTAIKDSHTARTTVSRAKKPGSLASVVASRVIEKDWILFILPILIVALVSIAKNNAVELCTYSNRPSRLPVPRPGEGYPATGPQIPFALQLPNVQLPVIGGRVPARIASQGLNSPESKSLGKFAVFGVVLHNVQFPPRNCDARQQPLTRISVEIPPASDAAKTEFRVGLCVPPAP
jgi:hypothetical protein